MRRVLFVSLIAAALSTVGGAASADCDPLDVTCVEAAPDGTRPPDCSGAINVCSGTCRGVVNICIQHVPLPL